MSLPYPMEIIPDEGGFVALIPDLPGCMSSGETVEEALKGLEDSKELWIGAKIDAKDPIPEPSSIEDYSGKFVLRIPKTLHRSLDHEAKKQGVSLNQHIVHLLSERHQLAGIRRSIDALTQRVGIARIQHHHHGAWSSWEETVVRTGAQFVIVSPGEGDPLENLPFLARPATKYTFNLQDVMRSRDIREFPPVDISREK